MSAVTGDLTMTLPDGTVLTDQTDVGLARQWAEHEHGPAWVNLSFADRTAETASALAELRRAHADE